MSQYVDGFLVPVKKDKVDAYREIATKAGSLWREHGALDYKECVADDVSEGKVTDFPRSVNLEADETVVFAWITYESRAERDRINKLVMEDPRMKEWMQSGEGEGVMDGPRMIYGGFEVIVSL
jgi:uncharacterized protein YbaA (DUF1428 family)